MNNPLLQLAVGSHRKGSGRGCAMNLVSYESGDTEITDYPACADRMLTLMVQRVNDNYCVHLNAERLLCPPCSIDVLDLAHRTVGTAGDDPDAIWLDSELCALKREVLATLSVLQISTIILNDFTLNAEFDRKQSALLHRAKLLPTAHAVIDRFEMLTGCKAQPVSEEATQEAVACMLQTA
jgi:hypothetical protein